MKRLLSLLLIPVIFFSVSSCNNTENITHDDNLKSVTEIAGETVTIAESETTGQELTESSAAVSGSTTAAEESSNEMTAAFSSAPATKSDPVMPEEKRSDKSFLNNNKNKETLPQKTNEKKSEDKSDKEKITKASAESRKNTITCYISIECKKALENEDKFSDEKSLLPSDGYILHRTAVTADSGSSAYDLLVRTCQENGIALSEKNTAFGKYVSGIADIDEKECGAYSGWLYSVNGKTPGRSSDKYILSDNEEIVFSYTC